MEYNKHGGVATSLPIATNFITYLRPTAIRTSSRTALVATEIYSSINADQASSMAKRSRPVFETPLNSAALKVLKPLCGQSINNGKCRSRFVLSPLFMSSIVCCRPLCPLVTLTIPLKGDSIEYRATETKKIFLDQYMYNITRRSPSRSALLWPL